jgi:hypothetical protein
MVLDGLDLVEQVMGRQGEPIARAPGSPDRRERCTRGWQSQSCKKRTCRICRVVWVRDWPRVLFEALMSRSDGHHDAGPPTLQAAVGGTDGVAPTAVMVGC